MPWARETDKQDYSVFYSEPNSGTGQCGAGFIVDAQV